MFDPTAQIDLEARLDRKQSAAALTAHGFKTSEATLATLRQPWRWSGVFKVRPARRLSVGRFAFLGQGRLTGPVNSTSQLRPLVRPRHSRASAEVVA